MAVDPKLVVGDRPTLSYVLRNQQTNQLITDIVSATLRWRLEGGVRTESDMEVASAQSVVSYTFQENELNVPGTLRTEVHYVDAAGRGHTSGEVFTYPVRKQV